MHTHQGQIDAGLYPTEHALDVVLVGVLIHGTEESACIIGPPGDACSLHAKTRCDLAAEGLPVVAYITTPHRRAVSLDTGESAAGEDDGLLASFFQTFIDSLVDKQGIDIAHLFTTPAAIVHTAACEIVVLRLCGILPPRIYA